MRRFLMLSLLSVGFCSAVEKPNIVLILADDLGWSDTSLTGSKYYKTPNIERLAKRGVFFSNAYSASPLCSPTRCSIMTGQNPARTGFTSPTGHLVPEIMKASVNHGAKPTDRQIGCTSITRMSTDHFTLAEALKEGGYATGHFGKWHLGREPYSPLQHGFDVDIPHWYGPGPAGSFVAPWKFPDFKEKYPKEHLEDRMSDEAVNFMEVNCKIPFFLNYWQFSVHAPFDAKAELIEQYKKTRDPKNPQQSPTYAAMIHSMDDGVGKILDTLDRLGIAEKTIIIFYSDNGGNMYNVVDEGTATSNAPLRGGKASMYEGGIRIPGIVCWPGVTKGGTVNDSLVQSEDLYPTILEMAGLPARPEQALDAFSMVPAIKGGEGLRKATFSFFPHAPHVPEWLPPSVCVRSGDWKLIRIFHDAPGGGHRYELYNLVSDIGERNNLAASQPERVQAMDAMIEKFLTETSAVVPQPNPKFDPETVNTFIGWRSEQDCVISPGHGIFQLRSFGETPRMRCEKVLKIPAGKYSVEMRIRSWAGGAAYLQWNGKGAKSGSIVLPVKADGLWHDLKKQVSFVSMVKGMALQPASRDGSVNIAWIRLLDSNAKIVEEWDFSKGPVKKKQKAIGGWKEGGNGHAAISRDKGTLKIIASGGDPQLVSGRVRFPAGKYTFCLRIKSGASGRGLLFARPSSIGYQVGSGTSFAVNHDNQWQEIVIPLERDHIINELRLDPCVSNGTLWIDWMRLTNADGKVVKRWEF